MSHFKS